MANDTRLFEERLARLEQEVERLKRLVEPGRQRPWEAATGGPPPDPEAYEEFLAILRKNREADYAAVVAEIEAEEAAEKKKKTTRLARPKKQQGAS
jgi:hypothetical protein